MLAALSALGVLTLVGLALFLGGLLLRRVPGVGLVLGAVIVGFGLGIPAIVIDDNRAESAGGGGGSSAASSETASGGETGTTGKEGTTGSQGGGGASAEGKLIFTQTCGTCHTLKDAGTSGNVGPVLDQVKPDKARVEKAIEIGGTGSGAMPAGLLSGKEAQAVAEYVSSVAGK
jgi:mono/diheme cytochrome c family protein